MVGEWECDGEGRVLVKWLDGWLAGVRCMDGWDGWMVTWMLAGISNPPCSADAMRVSSSLRNTLAPQGSTPSCTLAATGSATSLARWRHRQHPPVRAGCSQSR